MCLPRRPPLACRYGEYWTDRSGDWVLHNKGDEITTWACPIANTDGNTLDSLGRTDPARTTGAPPNLEHWLNAWYSVAKRFKDNPDVWFELFNEPYQRYTATFDDPACTAGTPGTSVMCPPGTGYGDNVNETNYNWTFWSHVMESTIGVIRDRAQADNILIVNGLDFAYDYVGDGTSETGGPAVRPELMPWSVGPTARENIAFALHPYQHGACCGTITDEEDTGTEDKSKSDPYQSVFCMYGSETSAEWPWDPSQSPLPGLTSYKKSDPHFPGVTHCDTSGYSPTSAKKAPPCTWAPNGLGSGICAGDKDLCGRLSKAECCAIDDASPDAGGWSKYILPMTKYGPLVATELGSFDCSSPFVSRFIRWADALNVSYSAFAVWPQNSGGPGAGACGYPSVLQPYTSSDGTLNNEYVYGSQCPDVDTCNKNMQAQAWSGVLLRDHINTGTVPPNTCEDGPVGAEPPSPPNIPPLPAGCYGGNMAACGQHCRSKEVPIEDQQICVVACVEHCTQRRRARRLHGDVVGIDEAVDEHEGTPSMQAPMEVECPPTTTCDASSSCVIVQDGDSLLAEVDKAVSDVAAAAACILLDGTHFELDRGLQVVPGYNVSLVPKQAAPARSLLTSGMGHAVDAPMVLVDRRAKASLTRLNITGGYTVKSGDAGVSNSGELWMFDCGVHGNSAHNNTVFAGGVGNDAQALATMVRVDIFNNSGEGTQSGGGIANEGTMNLTECNVFNNSVPSSSAQHEGGSGGGIGNDGHLTMRGCVVKDNTAGKSGGGLGNSGYVNAVDCEIAFNHAGRSGGGIGSGVGGLSNEDAHITLVRVSIHDNTAGMRKAGDEGGGGGVGNGAFLNMTDCDVFRNNASQGGGGIGTGTFSGLVIIENSRIFQNLARSGGGIANQLKGYVYVGHSRVYNNSASVLVGAQFGNGGGVSSQDAQSTYMIEHSEILFNQAELNGGGLSLNRECDTLILNSVIRGNKAGQSGAKGESGYGGGICNTGSSVAMTSVALEANEAITGGALALTKGQGSMSPKAVLTECNITSNNVTESGGGLYKLNGQARLLRCTIAGNSAPQGGGGGVHSDSEVIDPHGHVLNPDDFTILTTCLIEDNVAVYGGGIANYGKNAVLMDGTLLRNNVASLAMIGAGSAVYNTVPGGISYVLPAPVGRYVEAASLCNKVECPPIFPWCPQYCDWERYSNRTLVQLPLSIDNEYPFRCPPGFYGNGTDPEEQSTSECSGLCPRGFFCDGNNDDSPENPTMPQMCAPGTFAFALGTRNKGQCTRCPRNSFANTSVLPTDFDASHSACILCQLNSETIGDGAESRALCECVEGWYRIDNTSAECLACPAGSRCYHGSELRSIEVQPGYWRPSALSSDVRPCPDAEIFCHGTNSSEHGANVHGCGAGLSGPFCRLCSPRDGYYADPTSGSCVSCDGNRIGVGVLGSVLFFCLLVLTASRFCQADGTSLPRGFGVRSHSTSASGSTPIPPHEVGANAPLVQAEQIPSTCDSIGPSSHANDNHRDRNGDRNGDANGLAEADPVHAGCQAQLSVCTGRLVGALQALKDHLPQNKILFKQAISYYQIVTHAPAVFQVILPSSYLGLLSTLEIFNGNPSFVRLSPTCFGLSAFIWQLLALALIPVAIVSAAFGIAKCRFGSAARGLPFVIMFTFLTFSFVSSMAFQAFGCECFEIDVGTHEQTCYLRADYGVTCSDASGTTPEYTSIKLLASVLILLYPVGVPALYATLLKLADPSQIERDNTLTGVDEPSFSVSSQHSTSSPCEPRAASQSEREEVDQGEAEKPGPRPWLKGARVAIGEALNFLTADYQPDFYYWELVETSKKLLLTGFAVLVAQGTMLQLFAALLVTLCFLVAQLGAWPYKRRVHNIVATIANLLLLALFFFFIILEEQRFYLDEEEWLSEGDRRRYDLDSVASTWIFYPSTLAILLIVVALICLDLAKQFLWGGAAMVHAPAPGRCAPGGVAGADE